MGRSVELAALSFLIVAIAAGVLVPLGVFVLVAALLLMDPLLGVAGAASAGCGIGILRGQRKLARR